MNKFSKYISSQFKNPRGIGGVIISIIQNVINKAMYKRAVSLINLQSNENILDIGYGNGHLLEMIVTVQNPSGSMTNCCAKQRIEKIFSALNCCCFVDKNDDLLSIYPPCG